MLTSRLAAHACRAARATAAQRLAMPAAAQRAARAQPAHVGAWRQLPLLTPPPRMPPPPLLPHTAGGDSAGAEESARAERSLAGTRWAHHVATRVHPGLADLHPDPFAGLATAALAASMRPMRWPAAVPWHWPAAVPGHHRGLGPLHVGGHITRRAAVSAAGGGRPPSFPTGEDNVATTGGPSLTAPTKQDADTVPAAAPPTAAGVRIEGCKLVSRLWVFSVLS